MEDMENRGLTEKQRDILDFLNSFIAENGYPPSLREICARFHIKGPKNAGKHLTALEKKGFIKRSSGLPRAVRVVGPAPLHPPAPPIAPPERGGMAVPIAGRVRAGTPHLAIEDIAGYVTLDEPFFKCSGAFLLKIEGDSMIGAGINDGDYIVVKPDVHVVNNDIVVALLNEEATVKRLFKMGDMYILKPENPMMEPVYVKEGSGDFSVIGKVISIIKRLGEKGGKATAAQIPFSDL